jgi:iron complex outermembrane receptor protein
LGTPFSIHAADPVDLGTVGASSAGEVSVPAAAKAAPSQSSLSARSAQSQVSDEYIRNFTSPVADYTQVLQMAPGMFSYNPNGPGLGDAKMTMRGYSDSNAVISFDGIPFNDTNGVSHHSWVFFPSQFTGGAVIDRSPGSAATIGQATFGGNINLLSRVMEPQKRVSIEGSYGSWNTKLLGAELETGQFGTDGTSNLLINVHEMKSDGYQTFNAQKRDAISAKYQYAISDNTVLTAFASFINLKTNTPSIKGVTRANVALGNYNQLLGGDPTKADYFGYNFYNILTDFNYIGISSNLGNGWKLEDKAYVYRYWNKQNYNNFSYSANGITPNPTSLGSLTGVDKLNSYVTKGNLLRLSQESQMGTFRAGLWYDVADSWRYQVKSNPKTWVDAPLPNFNETYTTTTTQPYVEYEFKLGKDLKITPGVKYASYKQDFNHLQDCSTVGGLGATVNTTTCAITGGVGAASVSNSVSYSDVLPSLDVHYQVQPNWSVYGQYAYGDQIPDTGVFDVKNAKVLTTPKPTKSTTAQVGSVWKSDKYTLDVDIYRTQLDSPYSTMTDTSTGLNIYLLNGSQINQGIEAESNIVLGGGFSVYLNATYGSAKFDTGKWVAGAPTDTETLGLNYQQNAWNVGWFTKRVGKSYNDGTDLAKNIVHEAFTIDPVVLTNLFVNYAIKNPTSFSKQAKVQFGINNLFNSHRTVGVAGPVAGSSSAAPNVADLLTVLPERSTSLTLTLDF